MRRRSTKKQKSGGRRIITIINPASPLKLNGGTKVKSNPKKRRSSSRRRANSSTRKTRKRSSRRSNPATVQARSAAAPKRRSNPSRRRRRNGASRRASGWLRNPALSGLGDVITQSVQGAAGAFTTNVISGMIPINFGNPLLNLVKKSGAAILTGMAFSRFFGKKAGDAAVAGGFIAVALDAGALLFPNYITPPTFVVPNVLGSVTGLLGNVTGAQAGAPAVAEGAGLSGIVEFEPNLAGIVEFDADAYS